MDQKLQILLLGVPEMVWQTRSFNIARRQARALLYRLAEQMQPVTRDTLLFLLWPDMPETTARRNLKRLLSYVRMSLPQPDMLLTSGASVALNPDLVWSDTVHFAELSAAEDETGWETAVSFYRNRFLDGFSMTVNSEFDHWVTQVQRQYERVYLDVLGRLVIAKANRNELASAIQYAQEYLATDDLSEEMHRQLITLFAAKGDRTAALRQFEECAIVLERELGVSPLPETRSAYEAARDGTEPPVDEALPKPEWTTLPGLELPLVGRNEAWQALSEAYSLYHNGGVILISGEAGVGKSRLLQAFATAQNGLVLTGNGYATGQALPYYPLIQALRLALPLKARWRKIKPLWLGELSRLVPQLHDHFRDLPEPVAGAPQQVQARLFEALTEVFASLASDSPLLLCLDDVHWADEATLDWLVYMTHRLAKSGVCILATYRTHEVEALANWRRALSRSGRAAIVQLSGLSESAIAALLIHTGAEQTAAEPLSRRIHAATGGNAFFVLETMRELLTSGQISVRPENLPLPQTVRDAVLRRVNRMSPLAQQLATVAAVLSLHLTVELLAETSGRSEVETATGLDSLVFHQLLHSDGSTIRFQHDLARQAIYESITPWRRRLLHRRAAEGLELLHPNLIPFYASLAHHWTCAIEIDQPDVQHVVKAVGYLQRTGEQAVDAYANQEAIAAFIRALTLLDMLPATEGRTRQEIDLHLALAPALRTVKGYLDPEVERSFSRARALCQELGETTRLLPALWGLWSYYLFRAQHRAAYDVAKETLAMAERQEDPALQVMAHQIIGGTLCWLGEFDSALQHLETGIALYEPLFHRTQVRLYGHDFGVLCLALSANVLWIVGCPEQALNRIGEAIKLARTLSFPFSLGYVYIMAAWLHTYRREGEAAQEWAEAAIALAAEYGISTWGVWAQIHRGVALIEQGSVAEGITQVGQGLTAWRSPGTELTVTYSLSQLARACGMIGRNAEGLSYLAEALVLVQSGPEPFWEAELHRLQGELLEQQAEPDEVVEDCFRRAVEIARRQGAKSLELRATISLCRLWQRQGKREEPRQKLSGIHRWFTEGFTTADLQVARALLEELS